MSRDSPPTPPSASRGVRAWIVLAYGLVGLAVVVASGLTSRVYRVPLDAQFGLFQLLPPLYWLGLSLIATSTVVALWIRSDWLVAVTGAILLGVLAGTPSLFEPAPRIWDTYMHFSEAQTLTESGRLPSDPWNYSANWPGAFLTIWTLFSASGASAMDFLGLYPFLTGGITFLALFELLRATFNGRTARYASVPTALFAVWAQFHASPQSLGFVLLLLILATFRRQETRWRLVALALFGGLVVSHPTSAILLLSILGVHALLSSVSRLHATPSKEESRRAARHAQRTAITFAIIWLAWLFFLAVGSSETARVAILTRMESIVQLPEQTVNVATQRTTDNFLPLAPIVRFASLGVYGLFGLVSLAAMFRDRGSRDVFRIALSALLGPGIIAFADIFAFGGQFYDRSLLLFAAFAPGLCFAGIGRIRIPKAVRRGALALLLGASVATAGTTYYLEVFNFVPVESVTAANFVNTLPPNSVVMDGKYPVPVWVDPRERPLLHEFTFSQVYPTPLENLTTASPVYAVFDPTAEIWHRQWYGSQVLLFYSDEQPDYSLIYDNGWTRIYAVHN